MASQSMAEYWKTAGLVVLVGWWLMPIISLLVNKLIPYLFSDVSRKFHILQTTIVDLEKTLRNVQEQRMMRSFRDSNDESLSAFNTLAKVLEADLKSALYEAEDIMDLVDYHRAEEEAVGRTSSWVRQRLAAARACFAGCFRRSWVWLRLTPAAVLKCALRLYQLGRSTIQGLLSKMLSAVHRLLWQHLRKFKRATPQTLPVSIQTSSSNKSSGSLVGPVTSSPSASQTGFGATTTETDVPGELGGHKPPLLRPAQKVEVVDEEEEKVEEEKVKEEEEQEEVKGEIEEEKEEEEEEKKAEEIEVEEEKNKEETEEQNEETQQQQQEEENGAPWLCVRQCFQCMPTWLTNAIKFVRTARDLSYEGVGIESNQRSKIAEYSLFPPFGANSLSKRIQHIENILDDSKKSNLLNRQSGNSKESSSSELSINDTKKESSRRQEQIDKLDREIVKVFGRDTELKRIRAMMFRERPCGHDSKTYSVLGIHGIPGSGKSTLANYVCEHEKKAKEKYFDLIVFSHVSVNFRVDNIFRDMLREINKDEQYDSQDIEFLRNELTGQLKGKRFLLVLDDLWVNDDNQKERNILLDALNAGQNGSIIIVTARRDDAAAALGAEEQISIPDLEEEEYLSLFMHHALQGAVHDKGEFERIGKIIVGKLHRSPIAAVTVAKQLQMNKSIGFWQRAASLDVWKRTMGALWWSYQQLEVDIRRCFAYCSTFPAGYKLKRDVLVRIWIAQGFVRTTGNTTEEMEDVGDRYFDELVKSSFLQVTYSWGDLGDIIEEFTIHDLLHGLAEMVAESDFFRIDDLSGLPPAEDIPRGVRHLFIGSKNAAEGAQTAEENLDLGNLCTLIIDETYSRSRKQSRHGLEKIFERLFMRLRKLRVLIIQLPDSYPEEWSLPASIGQMKHLRYFSFDCSFDYNLKLILPRTFSKLYQMLTIFFSLHAGTVSYPDGMANLIRLRHVRGLHDVPNISRMTSLQTMHSFGVKKEQGYELKQLKQLNKLRGTLQIFGLENVGSKEEADLASKKRVTDLGLFFDLDGRTNNPDIEAEVLEGLCPPKDLQELTIQGYRGSRYPSWMLERGQQHHPHAPKHLRRLALKHCSCPLASFPEDSELFKNLHELFISYWEQDSLPENMERLVSLQSLSIVGCRHSESTMVLGPTLPTSLRKIWIYQSNLVLGNMEDLVWLEDLGISSCDKMEFLPKLPQSLKKISISGEVLGRTCEEEEHENWRMIQHIGYRAISYGNKTTIWNL